MKIYSGLLTTILMLLLLPTLQGLEKIERNAEATLMAEYIPEFKVKVADVKNLIANQFSKFSIGTVKTSYATIDKAEFAFSYKNGSVVTYQNPLKVEVTNDSFSIVINFTVTVQHTINKTQYTCQYSLPNLVSVNYTKEIDLKSGSTLISNSKTTFGPADFAGNAVCTKKPTDKDKMRIHEVVSGTESSSIYLQLKKGMGNIPKWMQQNSENQHFSEIFPINPYHYQFYNYNVDVDVSTVGTQQIGDTGVVNKIKGTIPGASHFTESLPTYEQGYNLFITQEFMINLIEDSLKNNDKWKNIQINRTNMRTRSFRFRLIDYEQIVPGVLKKYPKLYLEDTQISCSVKSYQNFMILKTQNISVQFTWSCIGSVMVDSNTQYNFINFEPTLLYEVTVDVRSSNYLTVYQKVKSVVDLNFNIIDGNQIQDFIIAKYAMEEGLFEFQGYPIGGFFKVKEGSSQVKLVKGQGLWVG